MPFHGCDNTTSKTGRPLTSEGLYLCLMMSCYPLELESPNRRSQNNKALFFPREFAHYHKILIHEN